LTRPDEKDAILVCCDEERCHARTAFDPVTGRSAQEHERRAASRKHSSSRTGRLKWRRRSRRRKRRLLAKTYPASRSRRRRPRAES